uniref:Metal dependent phosphohydrolase n=1 Tax=Cyanothece sp. (strain PCC 7425 / ATCC 29141) TaxID=395961 RepID=B8HMZ5_CYAP4
MFTMRYNEALEYTAWLHRHQPRKGTETPYISHLVAVSMIAQEYGADEDEAIAALLHDAVEDQGGVDTLNKIREKFGDRVAEIVEGCSDSVADTTQGEEKLPWKDRKQAYIDHIASASPSVRLVSAADKLHNAMCIVRDYDTLGYKLWEKFKGGREGTVWYYRSLVDAIKNKKSPKLLRRLIGRLDGVVSLIEYIAETGKNSTERLRDHAEAMRDHAESIKSPFENY